MLGKLLKHEFRATARTMLPMFGVVLVLSLLANLSFARIADTDSGALDILFGLFIVAFFLGLFTMGVMSLVVMIQRFYKNVLGDEGYLTLTLPVNVHEILWSKLIVSFVWFLATGLIAIAAVFVAVFTLTYSELGEMLRNMPSFGEMLRLFFEKTDITPWQLTGAVAQFAAMIILSSLTACLHFYAAMALGHSFSNNKVLLSVVFFIAISFFFSFVTSLLGICTDGISLRVVEESGSAVIKSLQVMTLGSAIYTLIEGAILYLLTTYCLKHRLNLN
ncbi:MAG: hypothetical protein SPI09_03890 [Candidatus Limivicinus sp.]|nr:hypothetical protein [Clostridiales bacterium]MDY6132487.1 hypothetical protein [Candidatus Limivicinus sp.]